MTGSEILDLARSLVKQATELRDTARENLDHADALEQKAKALVDLVERADVVRQFPIRPASGEPG